VKERKVKHRLSSTLDPTGSHSSEALPLDSNEESDPPQSIPLHQSNSELDLHKVINTKINRWLENKRFAGFAANYLNPYLLLKSLLVSIIIYFLLWAFPYPLATFYFPFLAIYSSLVLDKKAVERFKSWKKKDPANLKIKDKIHFYESFGELDLPVKRKASEVRKRHSAMLHSEDYLKFRSVDNLVKNNMVHRRTGSQPEFSREENSPPQRLRYRELSFSAPRPETLTGNVASSSGTGGGSSGGSGDDESKEVTITTSNDTIIVNDQLAEKEKLNWNSKDEARNELSELQKERKVKSTLVLLKKQHPSFVEGIFFPILFSPSIFSFYFLLFFSPIFLSYFLSPIFSLLFSLSYFLTYCLFFYFLSYFRHVLFLLLLSSFLYCLFLIIHFYLFSIFQSV
jgi:hypothetical protein